MHYYDIALQHGATLERWPDSEYPDVLSCDKTIIHMTARSFEALSADLVERGQQARGIQQGMSLFVPPDQLVELTGYKLPAKQRQWLEKNGVPHSVNAAGRPVVLVAVLEQMHGLRREQASLIDFGQVA